MSRPARGALLAAAAFLAALLLAPAAALGHAVLVGTEPERGAATEATPGQVVFRFSEAVEGSFGAVRVFDAEGERVDTGELIRPGGRSSEVATPLRPEVPDGTYTATYRVISADSHPVSGGFVFSIGAPGQSPAQELSDLIDEGNAGPVTSVAFGAARWLDYAAIALAIGTLSFLHFVWRPALGSVAAAGSGWRAASQVFARRTRRLLAGAIAVGVASGVLGIILQGATAAGVSFWQAASPSILGEVLDTRFGTVWGLRVLVWLLLAGTLVAAGVRAAAASLRPAELGATGLVLERPPAGWRLALLALPLVLLALSPALAGHASTQSPSGLLVPVDVLHVVAMSVWIGGLVLLLLVLPGATRRLEPGDRSRLLAATLVRFSPIALAAVAVLLGSGLVQSYVHVRSLDNLLGTAFGLAALAKFCLLLALIALGAVNRQRVLPRLRRIAQSGGPPGGAGRLLRRTLCGEVALLAVVLGVTSALVSFAPATTASSGPFSASGKLGPAQLDVTVDPATVGSNEVHLYLINASDGSQYTETKELEVQLSFPDKQIGPLAAEAEKAGPGHYVVPAAAFGVTGDWELEITSRISRFDESQTTLTVPIE